MVCVRLIGTVSDAFWPAVRRLGGMLASVRLLILCYGEYRRQTKTESLSELWLLLILYPEALLFERAFGSSNRIGTLTGDLLFSSFLVFGSLCLALLAKGAAI